jgi:hypothetical protein
MSLSIPSAAGPLSSLPLYRRDATPALDRSAAPFAPPPAAPEGDTGGDEGVDTLALYDFAGNVASSELREAREQGSLDAATLRAARERTGLLLDVLG